MAVAITIRNVPADVRNELAAKAAAHGWSLQRYLLTELEHLAQRPSNADIVGRARSRLTDPGPSINQILSARDADRA